MKVKNALSPTPGAREIGTFPKIPPRKEPIAVATQVTVTRAPLSIPVRESTAGFTNMM